MVKSPVEGNSIVLLKMDQPVVFSDFARPICLPSSDEFIHMGASCVTLAWDGPGTYVLKDVICIFWLGRVCKYFSGSGTRPITWAPYKFGQSSHWWAIILLDMIMIFMDGPLLSSIHNNLLTAAGKKYELLLTYMA